MLISVVDLRDLLIMIKLSSKELNNTLRKITNNAFRTKKIKIPEEKKLKTYEYVKYVYELKGKK
jgi:CRISPR/Cas system CSM-associated protein Csm5 (group 7 of RAMP superfamily)